MTIRDESSDRITHDLRLMKDNGSAFSRRHHDPDSALARWQGWADLWNGDLVCSRWHLRGQYAGGAKAKDGL